jgi:uncharacterized protein (DUF885 family)
LNNFPKDFTEADKAKFTKEYTQIIQSEIIPAYSRLAQFIQSEYLPKSRTSTGISAIPNGAKYYQYLIRVLTTTNKPADEIYQTGLSEVKRIRTEMEKIKDGVSFKGDLKAFFEFMRTDKQFTPYQKPEQVLAAFETIHKTMEPSLKKMFGREPKTPFEIRQTEAFRAASASAEYFQGSEDGTRPGIFYVPILDATKFNTTSGMESSGTAPMTTSARVASYISAMESKQRAPWRWASSLAFAAVRLCTPTMLTPGKAAKALACSWAM